MQRQSSRGLMLNEDEELPNTTEFYDNKSPRPQKTGQQQQQVNKKEQEAQRQSLMPGHNIRSSIVEFEQLEQECIEKYSPVDVYKVKKQGNGGQAQLNNKKKKKLFDDSDDDNAGDFDQEDRIRDEETISHAQNSQQDF